MIDPRSFFVYVHMRSGSEEVIYVGKGSWTKKMSYGRATSDKNRNALWQRTVAKAGGFNAVVIAEFFAEQDAFNFEAELIALHGRRDKGGSLCNLTDGGEGGIGRVVRRESIEKFKKAMAGRLHQFAGAGPMKGRKHNESSKLAISCAGKGELNGMFGRVHTNEARTKMSLAVRQNHPKAKPVIDTVSGQTFKSAREAARQTGINANTLKAWLSGRFANQSSLRYT